MEDGLILTGGMDNDIKLVDIESLSIFKTFEEHKNYIRKDIIFITSLNSFLAFDED